MKAAVSAALALALLAAAPAAADIGPFTGAGTGLLDRFHHMEDPAAGFYSDSKDVYRSRFTYSFSIDENGTVRGRGRGVYQSATWRLEGRNGDKGAFGCDIPVMVPPNYVVDVRGHVEDGAAKVIFELVGAEESNDEYDCGADYKGLATSSTYLATSLRDVQRDGLSIEIERPRIAPLRLLENIGDQSDGRVILHEWDISIRPPDRRQDSGPNAFPGSQSRPGSGFSICTIEGTAGSDRLNGTRGNDVICAYGGNDRINGRGGHDLVYAGPGNDRVKGAGGLDTLYGNAGSDSFDTRDRKRDKAHGGAGSDSARTDRVDTTVSVESRR